MQKENRCITVAIDARIPDTGLGGVQQVIRSLATGFSELESSNLKRVWIVYRDTNWWQGVFPPDDQIIQLEAPLGGIALTLSRKSPRIVSFLYPIFRLVRPEKSFLDETLKAYSVDIVHLPFQDGIHTELPTIYHPHDLQHIYLPQNFNWFQRHHRNTIWKRQAERARIVMAASLSVEQDLQQIWNIDPLKIRVIPIPPPNRASGFSQPSSLVSKPYILFPSVFWKHKNQEALIRAVHHLVNRGEHVTCVFSGAKGPTLKRCQKLVRKLSLDTYIKFVGHTPDADFGALINHSSCVVVPSLFEAASLTVWDAQKAGIPVACSDIPVFRNQLADTASYFDPHDSVAIANTISRVLGDTAYKDQIVKNAYQRISGLTSRQFAESMINLYRSI